MSEMGVGGWGCRINVLITSTCTPTKGFASASWFSNSTNGVVTILSNAQAWRKLASQSHSNRLLLGVVKSIIYPLLRVEPQNMHTHEQNTHFSAALTSFFCIVCSCINRAFSSAVRVRDWDSDIFSICSIRAWSMRCCAFTTSRLAVSYSSFFTICIALKAWSRKPCVCT